MDNVRVEFMSLRPLLCMSVCALAQWLVMAPSCAYAATMRVHAGAQDASVGLSIAVLFMRVFFFPLS